LSSVFTPLGDSAVTLALGEGISPELNDRVVAEARRISAAAIPGVHDVVAAYASLTIHYNPERIGYADLISRLAAGGASSMHLPSTVEKQLHEIPVRYDGEDIHEVAEKVRLSVDEVIRIHTSAEYRAFVIGFVPGFAYLGPLDARLALPRRDSPRKRVPAGSVAIAEAQTGVYPSETPGGWHLIGTTDTRMFDPGRERPALLSVGDRVRFVKA
jgi:KipI family sensor histidine kinase inhibitor